VEELLQAHLRASGKRRPSTQGWSSRTVSFPFRPATPCRDSVRDLLPLQPRAGEGTAPPGRAFRPGADLV
jgi:hypothetical protein